MSRAAQIGVPTRSALGEYLAGLPDGWHSFPSCQIDASFLLGVSARGSLDGLDLPEHVRAALLAAAGGWFPEVMHLGVFLALADTRFRGRNDELIDWVESLNRPLFVPSSGSPSYADPSAAVRDLPRHWARYHRGTTLELEHMGKHDASLVLRHPAGIYPPLAMDWRRRTFLVVLAGAGAVTPTASVEERRGVGTVLRLSW